MNNSENVELINQMLAEADLLHQDPAEQSEQESSEVEETEPESKQESSNQLVQQNREEHLNISKHLQEL